MTEVFTHEAVSVKIDPEEKMLLILWKKGSIHLSNDTFKEINLKYLEIIHQHQIKTLLINAIDLDFPISAELQDWVGIHVIEETKKLGIAKLATVVSHEFVTQMSIEQTFDVSNDNPSKKKMGYFGNEEEAILWLKE